LPEKPTGAKRHDIIFTPGGKVLHSGGDLSLVFVFILDLPDGAASPVFISFSCRRKTMTLDDAVLARHTVKAFEGGKTLPQEQIETLLMYYKTAPLR
jgi:hypothetical protein